MNHDNEDTLHAAWLHAIRLRLNDRSETRKHRLRAIHQRPLLIAVASETPSPKMPCLSTGNFAAWRGEIYDLLQSKSDLVAQKEQRQQVMINTRLSPIKPHVPATTSMRLHQVLAESGRGSDNFREISMQV